MKRGNQGPIFTPNDFDFYLDGLSLNLNIFYINVCKVVCVPAKYRNKRSETQFGIYMLSTYRQISMEIVMISSETSVPLNIWINVIIVR